MIAIATLKLTNYTQFTDVIINARTLLEVTMEYNNTAINSLTLDCSDDTYDCIFGVDLNEIYTKELYIYRTKLFSSSSGIVSMLIGSRLCALR